MDRGADAAGTEAPTDPLVQAIATRMHDCVASHAHALEELLGAQREALGTLDELTRGALRAARVPWADLTATVGRRAGFQKYSGAGTEPVVETYRQKLESCRSRVGHLDRSLRKAETRIANAVGLLRRKISSYNAQFGGVKDGEQANEAGGEVPPASCGRGDVAAGVQQATASEGEQAGVVDGVAAGGTAGEPVDQPAPADGGGEEEGEEGS